MSKNKSLQRRFDSAVGVLTSYLENNRSAYEALPEVLLGFAFLKEKCFQDAKVAKSLCIN